ncbi:MAG: hypothetical protein WBP81_39285 [Solirubrobacteraceae bacterium]
MPPSANTTTTNYQQVVVDVPEDRVAEFHAFLARFLAGPTGRGRRGRHGRSRHGLHGRRCGERREAVEHGEAAEQSAGTTEV